MRRYLVFLIVPCIFLLDRWTKLLIVENLAYLEVIELEPFFSLVHARNYGGAFGLFSGIAYKQFFIFFPLLSLVSSYI